MGIFSRTPPEERFWLWFQEHSDELFNVESDQARLFKALSAELDRVESGLTFEFGPKVGGRREFIISADGIRERFPAVRQLAAAAPPMPMWVVIPFRPPKDIGMTIEFAGNRLGPDDIWFAAEPDNQRIGLTLYIKGLTDANSRVLGGAGLLLLDNALGEFVVETQVGFIDWRPLPAYPSAEGLTPFRRIREVFDTRTH